MSKDKIPDLQVVLMNSEHCEGILKIADIFGLSPKTQDACQKILDDRNYYKLAAIYKNTIAGFLIARLIIPNLLSTNQIKTNTLTNQVPTETLNKSTKSSKTRQPEDYRTEAELHGIAVKKEFQNRQIGRWLLEDLKEKCVESEIREIWLEVRESNYQARKLYYASGFEIVCLRKNYYTAPPENALVMCLSLQALLREKKII